MTAAIDLFAGPGGWDISARQLGIVVVGIEWDADTCATRRAAGLYRTIHDDVRSFGPANFLANGLIASPPCPTFSSAGKGSGRRALNSVIEAAGHLATGGGLLAHAIDDRDERTALVLEPLRWAIEAHTDGTPYQWIALEQVPAVLPVWEAYAEHLRGIGYSVATGILHAEQYGVPQTRRRAILVARLDGAVALPAPTHSRYYPRNPDRLDPGVLPWVSMAETLGWGMTGRPSITVTGGGSATGGAEPFGNAARQGMRREAEAGRWAMRTSGASNRTCPPRRVDEPSRTILGGGQAAWVQERPATTVQGDPRLGAPGRREFVKGGPSMFSGESVRVTVQEAATLQSFPPDYPWQGTKTAQYQQVGNAIPPLLALRVLEQATGLHANEKAA